MDFQRCAEEQEDDDGRDEHRHVPYARRDRLDWARTPDGWRYRSEDPHLWVVFCVECGGTDGPASEQSPEVQQLRGPYKSEHHAKHLTRARYRTHGPPGRGVSGVIIAACGRDCRRIGRMASVARRRGWSFWRSATGSPTRTSSVASGSPVPAGGWVGRRRRSLVTSTRPLRGGDRSRGHAGIRLEPVGPAACERQQVRMTREG
jgi:hypothetical protein